MDILLKNIYDRLATIPELAWIDEDNGQLETQEESYPVQFPCALVSISGDINWQNKGRQLLCGDVPISIRIAFDIYEDSHTVPVQHQRDASLARIRLLNTIHSKIQAMAGDHYNGLDKIRTSPERREDKLKVFNLSYVTNMRDAHGMKQTTLVNAELKVTTAFKQEPQ
jgi:hypothetical protein